MVFIGKCTLVFIIKLTWFAIYLVETCVGLENTLDLDWHSLSHMLLHNLLEL